VLGSKQLDEVLAGVGDLLEVKGKRVGAFVVGGASLNLLGRSCKPRVMST
jgi:hypothetical protein